MAQSKPETIKKLRGQLLATIAMLHERGVSREAIETEIAKAAKVRFGDEADAMLAKIFEPEAEQARKDAALGREASPFRDGARGASIIGADGLSRGSGEWRPVAVEKAVTKSRRQRDEESRDEQVAKNMRKVHRDIYEGGQ